MLKVVVVAVGDLNVARVSTSADCSPIACDDGRRALNLLEDSPDGQQLVPDVSTPDTVLVPGGGPDPVLLDGGSA